MSDAMELISTMPTFVECDPLEAFVAVATEGDARDAAIDMDKHGESSGEARLTKYRDTRSLKELRFKAGAKPFQFIVRRLPIDLKKSIEANYRTMYLAAFCASVVRIVCPDGSDLVPDKDWLAPSAYDNGFKVVSEVSKWMQKVVDECGDCIDEIGGAALRFSGLPKAKRQLFGSQGG